MYKRSLEYRDINDSTQATIDKPRVDWTSAKRTQEGLSLSVQWLQLHLPMQGVWVWPLGGELRSYMPRGQKSKTKQKQNYNKFNKDFLNGPHKKIIKKKTRAPTKNLPDKQERWVQSLSWQDPLEEGMATHSSIHAWRIPGTEELRRWQSRRSKRI